MNVDNHKKRNQQKSLKKLNEEKVEMIPQQMAEQNSPGNSISPEDIQKIQEVFENKSNQFTFDNGRFMANPDYDIKNSFGLRYHIDKVNSFEEFEKRILLLVGNLTENDINRLEQVYKKYKNE